jgi:hypothetical protein
MGVSVGSGVNVSEGMAEAVNVGMGVKVSVTARLIGDEAGMVDDEAGSCPVLLKLQAHSVNIRITGRKSFLFSMS